jgi:hypothetical protein
MIYFFALLTTNRVIITDRGNTLLTFLLTDFGLLKATDMDQGEDPLPPPEKKTNKEYYHLEVFTNSLERYFIDKRMFTCGTILLCIL